jgi:trehalose 6-phosphate synthase
MISSRTWSNGTWIAHGAGNADRETVDEHGHLAVPPENPSYTLRRVWLTPEQEKGYYYGFANVGLWPLCHIAFKRPVFRLSDWQTYQEVNRPFARAVIAISTVRSHPWSRMRMTRGCRMPRGLLWSGW